MSHKKQKSEFSKKSGTTAPEKVGPKKSVDEYSEVMRNESPSDKCLSSFVPKPRKIHLDILSEDERIILVLRQHVVTQLRWLLIVLVMLFLPFFFDKSEIFSFLPARYQFAAGLGWYLLTFGLVIESFLKWFYRVYIITDERIIDVDFLSMVYKDISTTKIDKIEDITSISTGFFASLIDYGNVIVQTAATKQEIEFEKIPQPSKVTSLLNDLIVEEEVEKYEGRVN